MTDRHRRSTDKIDTLNEALKLYPPENEPTLKLETTTRQQDTAGWILASAFRRLVKEMIEFRRLFRRLKGNAHWNSEYGLVRKEDVDAIEELWLRTYRDIERSQEEDPPPDLKKK